MSDLIGEWLGYAVYRGCDLGGLERFWQGVTIWMLVGIFSAVNLLILMAILVRPFTRAITDRGSGR